VQVVLALLAVVSSGDQPQHHHQHRHGRHHRHHHGAAHSANAGAQTAVNHSAAAPSQLAGASQAASPESASAVVHPVGNQSAVVPSALADKSLPQTVQATHHLDAPRAVPDATQRVVAAPHVESHGMPRRHVTSVRRHARISAKAQRGHPSVVGADAVRGAAQVSDGKILEKMQHLEEELDEKVKAAQPVKTPLAKGHLNVNGPLPTDFSDLFAQGVADATGCRAADVEVVGAVPVSQAGGAVEEVMFRSRGDVVAAVEDQAGNPESKLTNGILHSFLVAHDEPEEPSETDEGADEEADAEQSAEPARGDASKGPEVDMAMPYGDLEPFGREDTAQELTESSIRESNAMIDQLERAEVAEEKRAVFRALTRLRGAAITSYDGIARSQTGNIDDYARKNQWREAHPVHHLADEEADVSKWAFPESDSD